MPHARLQEFLESAQWLQDHVAGYVGCPFTCTVLCCVSHSWLAATRFSHGSLEHSTYACHKSRRKVSLRLPGACPDDGVSPARFAEAWWRVAREQTEPTDICEWVAGCVQDRRPPPQVSILCPHPGCDHEEPTPFLATCHASRCPVAAARLTLEGYRGFRYAKPELLIAAWRCRAGREVADVVLDRDFGGCLGGVLRESACEVDRRSPALLVYSGSAMKRFSLTRGHVEVSKGWCLDEVARDDCERGAFPRVVKHLPLLQTNCLYDEHDMWHDDGYTLLLGWVLCVEHSAHAALRVISEEAWSRTLVIRLAALPGGEKQNIAAELMKKQKKGLFDHLRLYVPGFVDTMCPAAGDAWRQHLAQELRAAGQHLHKKKQSLLENFLAQSVEQAVCRGDIEAEYLHQRTDFIFLTFSSRFTAERFYQLLGDVLGDFSHPAPTDAAL
mmetsp:Transcript_1805/g.5011  ORF Transcript_1805/g.5011 Transcript_1805/m.5011 type:complete len:442 (-) Transcript_1805:75-1400(-)